VSSVSENVVEGKEFLQASNNPDMFNRSHVAHVECGMCARVWLFLPMMMMMMEKLY